MGIITEKDYEEIFPKLNYFNLGNIEKEYKDLYLYLTSKYREYLIKYIINATQIKEFDKKISNSELPFTKVNDEEKDFYQLYNDESLNYYYLRNNININRLSDKELKEFINLIEKDWKEIEKFIIKTFKKVIREADEKTKINYGPSSEKFYVNNGTLVIGIRYDEFDNNNGEWEENHNKEEFFLLTNNALLEKNIEKSLNIECSVIKYTDFSIKKRNK